MRWPLLLPAWLLLGTTLLAQSGSPSTCPYVRYILFDACGNGNEEGLNEHLVFYTPVSMNINALRVSFPAYPNQTGLDDDSPTRWVCYGCFYSWTCHATTISTMNSIACTGTTYTCPASGTTIPANSLIIVFAGVPTTLPNLSNLCGAGTVYVLFTNNTTGQGRYLNDPSNTNNRRTRIAFDGFPACSMTVNYRGISSGSNGNYLLINPNVCIGKTEGQNNSIPSTSACYYSGGGSNGVSLANAGSSCALPGLGVLPILWREVRVVGDRLRWAVAFEGEALRPLSLWHQPSPAHAPYRYRAGLGPQGELPLDQSGLYYLTIEGVEGAEARSPAVWYEGDARPYVRYEGRIPIIERSDEVEELQVWDMSGRMVLSASAPVGREVLGRLTEYGTGLYSVSMRLRSGGVRQERLLLLP